MQKIRKFYLQRLSISIKIFFQSMHTEEESKKLKKTAIQDRYREV